MQTQNGLIKHKFLKRFLIKKLLNFPIWEHVIHPNTVKPLENKNIPLTINLSSKEHEGSSISKVGKDDKVFPQLSINQIRYYLISSKDYSFIFEEHISDIFLFFLKLVRFILCKIQR